MDPRYEQYRDDREPWWEHRERSASGRDWQPEDRDERNIYHEPYGEGQQHGPGGAAREESRYAGDYDVRSSGRDFGQREYRRDFSDYAGFSPYSPYREGYRGYEGEPYYGGSGYRGSTGSRGQHEPAPYERAEHSGRAVRRGPKGYTRSDTRIEEDISDQLYQSEHIDSSEVTVKVKDGKVILDGTVPERWMKHAIEDVADQCAGVQDIENGIRLQTQTELQPQRGNDEAQASANESGVAK